MKSKSVAYLLWVVSIFGWLGLHRFYLRKWGTGVLWVISGGLLGLGCLMDLFTLGSQVEAFNAKRERAHLRSGAAAMAQSQDDA
jgi:TM2 domain-containing membrane protein YozV